MSPAEMRLAAELLDLASEVFSNHGCNDFDLEAAMPDPRERERLIQAYWAQEGDPEETSPDIGDDRLMGFLAERLRAMAEASL